MFPQPSAHLVLRRLQASEVCVVFPRPSAHLVGRREEKNQKKVTWKISSRYLNSLNFRPWVLNELCSDPFHRRPFFCFFVCPKLLQMSFHRHILLVEINPGGIKLCLQNVTQHVDHSGVGRESNSRGTTFTQVVDE